ncbi:MAG: phospholipase D-like domain-containing protein [Candidatus Micrarchaeota archaeon]
MRIEKDNRLIFLVLGILIGFLAYHSVSSFFPTSVVAVFSPGAQQTIVDLIDSAGQSAYVEMYVFSSDELISSLVSAKKRGVDVRVIMEKHVMSEENTRTFERLKSAGIEVRWASESFKLTHSKFIIIDKKTVLVGSHNWSRSALNFNREASVIISNLPLVSEFLKVFDSDWEIATSY